MSNEVEVARPQGRPPVIDETALVFVDGGQASTILQAGSDRRAMINKLVDLGGRATVKELNDLFGFDVRAILLALMREGWVGSGVQSRKESMPLPRRSKAMLGGKAKAKTVVAAKPKKRRAA